MMLRLRLVVAVLLVVAVTVGGLIGQDKSTETPKFKGTLPANWKKLGLTDDQVQMVYKIQSKYRTQIDQLAEQIKQLRKEEKGELEKVLTPAQKDRLREIVIGEKDKDRIKDVPPAKDKK
jgi:hypothetical protein